MNAVKRSLALLAATVAVGACGGDPTADLGGADLFIRATPTSVWMQADKTSSVKIEAFDATGAPAPGSWTATTTGVVTVAVDTAFQQTQSGKPLGTATTFIITPTTAGNGLVIFTGTGGVDTVRVRVSPTPTAFAATFSNQNPAIGETLVITAAPGLRFSATSTVNFVSGPTNATSNGKAAPGIVGLSADGTQLSVLPAPNAAGRLKITAIASVQTPTDTTNSITTDSVTVPQLNNIPVVFGPNPAADNAPVTVTLPGGTKFRPTSTVSTTGASQMTAFVLSRAADSSAITFVPIPGFDATMSMTGLQDTRVASLSLTLPSSGNLKASSAVTAPGHIVKFGGADPIVGTNIPTAEGPASTGAVTVFYDSLSHGGNDYVGDCGPVGTCFGQHIRIHANYTGDVAISVDWSGGTDKNTDLDVILVEDDGAYDTPHLNTSGKGFAAATGSKPEGSTWHLVAGSTYVLSIIDFGPLDGGSFKAVAANNLVRVVMTGQ